MEEESARFFFFRLNPNRRQLVSNPEDRGPHSPLTFSLLIAETVYRLVVIVERVIRWIAQTVLRPCRLQFRCLFW